jgi:CDP-diacylglycerol---serine O-phosphatidyltransferase
MKRENPLAGRKTLIPNSITMANLIIGFIAILYAAKGDSHSITIAGILIFAASFFDFFDGAAARLLDARSEIGGQLDSLADSVSYGIAPGVIAYEAYLHKLPQVGFSFNTGMFVAVVFPLFAVYRLARFNTGEETDGFMGLPSPAAGIFVASIPTLEYTRPKLLAFIDLTFSVELYTVLFIITGFLMVTRVDYNKLFADLVKRGRNVIIITVAVVIIGLALFNMWAVFVVTSLYILTGLVLYVLKKIGVMN